MSDQTLPLLGKSLVLFIIVTCHCGNEKNVAIKCKSIIKDGTFSNCPFVTTWDGTCEDK